PIATLTSASKRGLRGLMVVLLRHHQTHPESCASIPLLVGATKCRVRLFVSAEALEKQEKIEGSGAKSPLAGPLVGDHSLRKLPALLKQDPEIASSSRTPVGIGSFVRLSRASQVPLLFEQYSQIIGASGTPPLLGSPEGGFRGQNLASPLQQVPEIVAG